MEAESKWLLDRFEEQRSHLRSVAYRMLGSFAEADDALQDSWLRVSRAGADGVDNIGGWMTTIVARVCLNMLRSRNVRREDSLEPHVPDPIVKRDDQTNPEDEALLADSVGLALLVVLDTLSPPERLAFVLHDMFELPFDEIAAMVGRSPEAARQLASRARRRVRGASAPLSETDRTHHRAVVDAFFAAARAGDFEELVRLLAPDVVLRIDAGRHGPVKSTVLQGVDAFVAQARKGLRTWLSSPATDLIPAWVNGSAGIVVTMHGEPSVVMGFSVIDGKIVEIDSLADPDRVGQLAASVVGR